MTGHRGAPELIYTVGLPGAGKTTWALARIGAAGPGEMVRLNRDDLRRSMHGMPHYLPITEQQVTLVQHAGIAALLGAGVTVIVDDTNLDPEHTAALAAIAQHHNARLTVRDFTGVPVDECIARDLRRLGSDAYVSEEIIRAMDRRHRTS